MTNDIFLSTLQLVKLQNYFKRPQMSSRTRLTLWQDVSNNARDSSRVIIFTVFVNPSYFKRSLPTIVLCLYSVHTSFNMTISRIVIIMVSFMLMSCRMLHFHSKMYFFACSEANLLRNKRAQLI